MVVTTLVLLVSFPVAVPAAPCSPVKVNQLAYIPSVPMRATVVNGSGSPITRSLRDPVRPTIALGQTSVHDCDQLSGDNAHTNEFSSVTRTDNGFVLSAGAANS